MSVFDPDLEISVVVALTNHARAANKTLDITGVLIFDGERFCQYLEGATQDVANLFSRIESDARHTNVEMLHQGVIDQRHFRKFHMGFSYVADADVIGAIKEQSGLSARDLLFELETSIDLGS